MKIYLLFKENELLSSAYTCLKPLCNAYNVPYYGLSQVNKPMLIDGIKYEIKQATLHKIKGRGRRFKA